MNHDDEHKRIEGRIDSMQRRVWWLISLLLPFMVAGMLTAIAVYGDTQDLKVKESAHATKAEVEVLDIKRKNIDKQQSKALNWQAQALDAIADKLDVPLPPRPAMVEEQ